MDKEILSPHAYNMYMYHEYLTMECLFFLKRARIKKNIYPENIQKSEIRFSIFCLQTQIL